MSFAEFITQFLQFFHIPIKMKKKTVEIIRFGDQKQPRGSELQMKNYTNYINQSFHIYKV